MIPLEGVVVGSDGRLRFETFGELFHRKLDEAHGRAHQRLPEGTELSFSGGRNISVPITLLDRLVDPPIIVGKDGLSWRYGET